MPGFNNLFHKNDIYWNEIIIFKTLYRGHNYNVNEFVKIINYLKG